MAKSASLISGLFWNATQVLGNQVFGLVVKLVLARLLLPHQFGILSMAVVFTGLVATLNEMGMSAALVQRKEETITEAHYSSVFFLSVASSVIFFLLGVVVLAPATAAFYGRPELANITRVIMIPLLFSPVGIISRARLTKALRFKELSVASMVSSLVSGISAIIMALLGWGVWALVIQGVLANVLNSGITSLYVPWLPKKKWSSHATKEIIGYSVFLTLNNLTVFATKNTDYLLVGKLLGSSALGMYTIAFMLPDLLRSQLMGILNTVLFPVYSRMQSDFEGLLEHYRKVVSYNSMMIFPGLAVMAVFPTEILLLIFGSEWVPGAGALRILAGAAAVHVSGGASSTVLSAIGKSKLDFQLLALTTFTVTIPLFYIGIRMGGIEGCAYGALIGKALSITIRQEVLNKLIGMNRKLYIQANASGVRGALGVMGVGWALHFWVTDSPWHIGVKIVLAGAAGYLVNIKMIQEVVSPLLSKLPFKKQRA